MKAAGALCGAMCKLVGLKPLRTKERRGKA